MTSVLRYEPAFRGGEAFSEKRTGHCGGLFRVAEVVSREQMDFQRGEQHGKSEQPLRYCLGGRAGDGGGQLRATGDRSDGGVVTLDLD